MNGRSLLILGESIFYHWFDSENSLFSLFVTILNCYFINILFRLTFIIKFVTIFNGCELTEL